VREDALEIAAVPRGDSLGRKRSRERAVENRRHGGRIGDPRIDVLNGLTRWRCALGCVKAIP
jgi:hypothetical protein